MHEFGRLVLNKNPENFHRDVEQAAFSPGSLVLGIEDSPDPLLQFRMFFYRDAQYHRIGVNLHQIPVNCPFMAGSYSSLNFDGQMRVDANHAGRNQYVPNSFKNTLRPDTAEAPYAVADNIVSRKSHYAHEAKKSEYDQATELYRRVMNDKARQHLHSNTAKMLSRVRFPIIQVLSVSPCVQTPLANYSRRRNIWRRFTTSHRSIPRLFMICCRRRTLAFQRWRSCRRVRMSFSRKPSSGLVRMIVW